MAGSLLKILSLARSPRLIVLSLPMMGWNRLRQQIRKGLMQFLSTAFSTISCCIDLIVRTRTIPDETLG